MRPKRFNYEARAKKMVWAFLFVKNIHTFVQQIVIFTTLRD